MSQFQELVGRRLAWQAPKAHRRKLSSRGSTFGPPRWTAAEVEKLEERLVLSPGILAIGSDGGASFVNVFDSETGGLLYGFNPYADIPGFAGGVRTAVGYVRDGNQNSVFPVIVAAPGPGLFIPNPASPGPVRVYSGVGGTLSNGQVVGPGQLLTSLNPFPGFGGGIFVASADFDLDGFSEVVMGADEGGGPHVIISSLSPLTPFRVLFDQFVFDPNFRGGVRVATGNVNFPEDVIPDLIVAAGPGGGPHVKVFNGANGLQFPGPGGSFFAYSPFFTGGVYVAAGNFGPDPFNTTRAEVVTGAGAGGGPHVRIIDIFGQDPNNANFDLNRFTTHFPFEISFTGGVRVAAAYINNDILADLIVTRGPGFPLDGNDIRVFSGATGNVIYQGFAFNPRFTGGSFPSSGKFALEPLRIDAAGQLPPEAVTQITTEDVLPLVEAALARFEEAGVPDEVLAQLGTLEIHVTNLSGDFLGLAQPGLIILDDDAQGFGWFIDPTPFDDEEFGPDGFAIDWEALGRVDLLTVLLHEMGHHLGWADLDPDTHPNQLMTGTLNPGERRLPDRNAIDILFAGDTLLDRLLAPTLL